jgi:hypothetical protein
MTLWRDMTGPQKATWISRVLTELGGLLIWLGLVLLISVPLLIAIFSH